MAGGPRATAVVLALAALAFGAAPAGAARQAIKDGFTISGKAGGQVRVRLTKPLLLPSWSRSGPRFDLRAGSGPIAGYALLPTGNRRDFAYAVGTTPVWTCGAAKCTGDADLVDAFVASDDLRTLPPGEYTLLLIGAPGAVVTATVHPVDPDRRPTRVTPTAAAKPVVGDATGVATGTGVDPVATGTFTTPSRRAGLVGIVHALALDLGTEADFDTYAGWPGGVLDQCGGAWHGGSMSRSALSGPTYLTNVAVALVGAERAEVCGSWSGRMTGTGRQRGVGFFVPLVAR